MAYLEGVRACPPEKDPVRFQRIRTAFERLETAKKRVQYDLFNVDDTGPGPEELFEYLNGEGENRPSLGQIQAQLALSAKGWALGKDC